MQESKANDAGLLEEDEIVAAPTRRRRLIKRAAKADHNDDDNDNKNDKKCNKVVIHLQESFRVRVYIRFPKASAKGSRCVDNSSGSGRPLPDSWLMAVL